MSDLELLQISTFRVGGRHQDTPVLKRRGLPATGVLRGFGVMGGGGR